MTTVMDAEEVDELIRALVHFYIKDFGEVDPGTVACLVHGAFTEQVRRELACRAFETMVREALRARRAEPA